MDTAPTNHFSGVRTDVNWDNVYANLDTEGFAVLPGILSDLECLLLQNMYIENTHFRTTINMEKYRFGKGEYKYLAYPLPHIVQFLRAQLYSSLLNLANSWSVRLGNEPFYPKAHTEFLDLCRRAGQTRPTCLILKYEAGCYNCLHQDLYGDIAFPFQATLLLSQPGTDFTGGDLVLTEQRPRMQSKVSVVTLNKGDLVIFSNSYKPVKGAKGNYRVNLKHGVSPIKSGLRHTLGIIFHDSK